MTPQDITAMENQRTFIDIITSGFANGEIQGLIMVAEPTSLVLGGMGTIFMLCLVRFRSRRSLGMRRLISA